MEFDTIFEHGELVVQLRGAIYIEESYFLRAILFTLCKQNLVVTVDMRKVDYIDAAGLGVLVAAYKQAQSKRGSFSIINTQGAVDNLFHITMRNRCLFKEKSGLD